ncbi:hypothetical protein LP7551_04170 [Roseibium album]|nr:hypothetical protein LP7551_04170 [Roseibium album]
MPPKFNRNSQPPFLPSGSPIPAAIGLFAALTIEAMMLLLLYGTYTETMGMMSDVYLCDLPGAGGVFCMIDEEMTVSHLLAFLLAVFSILVPMALWSEVLSREIYLDPKSWLSNPTNKIYAIIALALYALVFTLETVNLYTLIAQEVAEGPFKTHDANPLMAFLAQNQGLGVFVAGTVAIVNTVLGLLAVRAAHTLKAKLAGV